MFVLQKITSVFASNHCWIGLTLLPLPPFSMDHRCLS